MQLEWLTELGLLQVPETGCYSVFGDTDSDALSDFQPDFRRAVVRMVTAHLSQTYPTPRLSTVAQARWCMAAIGQAFGLPSYGDAGLMNDAADIYSKWLLERNARPECFRGVGTGESDAETLAQQFLQSLFRHLSQLFEPRSFQDHPSAPPRQPVAVPIAIPLGLDEAEMVPTSAHSSDDDHLVTFRKYTELCLKVLKMFTMAGRLLAAEMSEETWRVLMRVVAGACDRLLRSPAIMETLATGGMPALAGSGGISTTSVISPTVGEFSINIRNASAASTESRLDGSSVGGIPQVYDLSGELCECMLQASTLFELCLRAPFFDSGLWDFLSDSFPRWAHRVRVMENWCAYTSALTQRVLRLLYGPGAGTPSVEVTVYVG
ncbi:hypothetical protein THASP1DRAFT_32553 [Thamnocephalis sphaerospora]|uniref:Ral GTPase-activating protein subunit alpha/beta N-terminal domain-containing protein n=1 Tax=Thamnocephalis sphaerospora TaxID=78915 RepID=A0A4P9XIR7_9FUNG|nr:hypothetical protein THASP1DRAFT_32553 [Thamnocephalis sphaerospora]|eukprot:RKP05607.1 hypothetical protein THASP1DRAFT_32553 [Thamnocephalis sphaerospora]